jgi:hypothetical protein
MCLAAIQSSLLCPVRLPSNIKKAKGNACVQTVKSDYPVGILTEAKK